MSAATASWARFLSNSLVKRPVPEEFLSFIEFQTSHYPISPAALCDLFLGPTEHNDYCLNTLSRQWVYALQPAGFVTLPAMLSAMMKYSTFGKKKDDSEEEAGPTLAVDENKQDKRWRNSYHSDEMLFFRMAKLISAGEVRQNTQRNVELLNICIAWMELVFQSGQGANNIVLLPTPKQSQKHAQIVDTISALGTLVVGVVESADIQKLLRTGTAVKGVGNHLSRALTNFIPLIQEGNTVATRLEVFRTQTLISIQPIDKKDIAASKEIDEMLGDGIGVNIDTIDVPDLPIIRSRAGLYIYLNALLVGRPLVDDSEILGYLNNRYQNDLQTMTIDFILAAFDALANVIFRKETGEKEQSKFVLRTFLINKVPLLIANLASGFFPPLSAEFCIGEALQNVDTNAFPTFASLSAESSYDSFSDSVRQDFCFACCLHGLLEESSIQDLLGDVPMLSLPTGGRYTKEVLIQQCLSDSEKPEALIDELENMDGNVGAVSQALTSVIGQLCANKDTMTLKSICAKLARKGAYLDVMLIFEKPMVILQPMCDLLDNWRYEEDQGEYQPVYEEFGSILLLVLAFVTRYDLSAVDIGVRSPSSFISKLIQQGHFAKTDDNITPLENTQLAGWIRGLFNNESGGLGDELMSACPPQDFYLLVATLFHQTVLACSTNHLPEDVLKLGLEYLVEPFLLPALVPGITWLSSHLWTSREDANAVIQILSALISNSNSISNEASHMLNSILNIVSKNLEHSLRYLQKAEPQRQDVEPLLRILRSNNGWERRGASDHTEYEAWTKSDNNHVSMCANIRLTVNSLVQWALNPGVNMSPTPYTHRQILVGLKILGAKKVLQTLLQVVEQQAMTNGSVVLDVVTAIICAPDVGSWEHSVLLVQPPQRRMTLREALKIEAELATAKDAYNTDTAMRVRLYRRVESQMLKQQPVEEDLLAGMGLVDVGAMGGAGAMDLDIEMEMDMGVDMGVGGEEADLFGEGF